MKYRVLDYSVMPPVVKYQGKSRKSALMAMDERCGLQNWLEGISKEWKVEIPPKKIIVGND